MAEDKSPKNAPPRAEAKPTEVKPPEPPPVVLAAKDVLAELAVSGSPWATSEDARAWAKENPQATAEALVEHLRKRWEERPSLWGTYRKAFKAVFGVECEPVTDMSPALEDEVKTLRRRVSDLEKEVAVLNAHLAAERRLLRSFEEEKRAAERDRLAYGPLDVPGVSHNPRLK